jgi:hypothetical protein
MPDDLDLEYTPSLESASAPDDRHKELLAAARVTIGIFSAKTPNPLAMTMVLIRLGVAVRAYDDKERPS